MERNKSRMRVLGCAVTMLVVSASSYAETITWTGAGDATSWHDVANWDLGRVPDGDDVVIPDVVATTAVVYSSGTTLVGSLDSEEAFELSGGTVIIETASLIEAAYTQTGGYLDGAGTLTVTGLLTWSGGDMEGTGITNADGGMVVDGNVYLRGDGDSTNGIFRTLNNNSTDPGARFTGLAEINMYDEAVFNNTGTMYVETDRRVLDFVAGSPRCTNSGMLVKSAGDGTAIIDVAFDNDGTVLVQSGILALDHGGGASTGTFDATSGAILEFSGGTHILQAGVPGSGDGVVEISGGTVDVAGNVAIRNLTITGGNLDGAGTLTVTGLLTWSGGDMEGTGITNADGGMVVDGTVYLRGDGNSANGLFRTLNNNSTDPGATFTGLAEINMYDEVVFNNTGTVYVETDRRVLDFVAGSPRCINSGMFVKSAGAETAIIDVAFDNNGTVVVQSGVLALNRGGGVSTGTFDATTGAILEFSGGTHVLQAGVPGSGDGVVEISGGTVDVAGNAAIRNLTITGGNLDGAGTLTVTGLLTWSGGDMEGTGITNADGGMVVDGNVFLRGDGNSTNGLFRTLNNNSTDPGATFTGLAEINMYDESVFNNTGTVYVETDRRVLDRVAGSPRCTNSGQIVKSAGIGTAIIDVDFHNLGTIDVQIGTLNLTEDFENFSGSTLTGGTYLISGVLQFDGANIVTNAATIVLDGPGSQIHNQSGLNGLAGFAANAAAGDFTITNGRELTTSGALHNDGVVVVGTASRLVVGGDYTQTAGETVLDDGEILADQSLLINGGDLRGVGVVGPQLLNSGAVLPGLSAGTLQISNDYTQAGAGALTIEIGGPAPGVDHDNLQIADVALLDGLLDVTVIEGFVPADGETFVILTATAVNGTFATESLPPPTGLLQWFVRYEPDRVILIAGDCVEGDPDDDGVEGCADLCPTTSAPGGVDGQGRPLGDLDYDCDVDLHDFAILQLNLTGPR